MIEVKGLTKFYGTFRALHDVSFSVAKGEVLGFLGPNGAGKSTTMKILTSYISASEGTATVCGIDVHAQPLEVRKRIGYLPENPPLYVEMPVDSYLQFAGRSRGLKGHALADRVDTVVQDCGLRPKLKARIGELSKGYRQRVGLAQALIHDPEVLILDEPTSGMDPMQVIEIRQLINRLRRDKCIIFSTHILQEATAVASRLVIINGGEKIADGVAEDLASKAADRQDIRVLVRGADAAFAEVLRSVPGTASVEEQVGPEGYRRYLVRADGGQRGTRETCERIAALAQGRNLPLAELAPEKLTLEGIFLNLLRKSADKADPKPVPAAKPAAEAPVAKPADVPEDPESTAAATRVTGQATETELYRASPSETAYDDQFGTEAIKAAETAAAARAAREQAAGEEDGDPFSTVRLEETETAALAREQARKLKQQSEQPRKEDA